MRKFLLNLQFIFKPTYWLMNNSYDETVDILMNSLMDKYDFTNITQYTAYLGTHEIWIANKPYATMVPRELTFNDVRGSRLTIQRGIKKLNDDKIKIVMKQIKQI